MPINKNLWGYFIALFVILGLLLLLIERSTLKQGAPNVAGQLVPPFLLTDLYKPEQYFTREDLHGKVVLLNVWASWCAPCQMEHPVLIKIKENYHVPIYGLNYKDDRKKALKWLNQAGDPYQKIGQDRDGKVATRLGIEGVPETFLIDSKGIVRYQYIGVLDETVWDQVLWPLVQRYQHDF